MCLCGHTPECEDISFFGNFNIICQSTRRHISYKRIFHMLKCMFIVKVTKAYTTQHNSPTHWVL